MIPDTKLIHAIGSAKKTADLLSALGKYYRAAESVASEHASADSRALACREGCAFCCHLTVGARAEEVLLIADFVRSHFSPGQQSALIDRLCKHASIVSPLNTSERRGIPCPLLDGSRCSVYSVRPLVCRAYHSLDVSSCENSFHHPTDPPERRPTIGELESAWCTMMDLARLAFSERGYDTTDYELGSALLEALTKPATSRRFFRRTKAFRQAKQL